MPEQEVIAQEERSPIVRPEEVLPIGDDGELEARKQQLFDVLEKFNAQKDEPQEEIRSGFQFDEEPAQSVQGDDAWNQPVKLDEIMASVNKLRPARVGVQPGEEVTQALPANPQDLVVTAHTGQRVMIVWVDDARNPIASGRVNELTIATAGWTPDDFAMAMIKRMPSNVNREKVLNAVAHAGTPFVLLQAVLDMYASDDTLSAARVDVFANDIQQNGMLASAYTEKTCAGCNRKFHPPRPENAYCCTPCGHRAQGEVPRMAHETSCPAMIARDLKQAA